MKIKDVLQFKKSTIVTINVSISNIVKKISKSGRLFYFLDISDGFNTLEVCISQFYFEQEMKAYDNQRVGEEISNRINDKINLDEFTHKYSKVKLQCMLLEDNSTMLYYILNLEQLKD